MITKRREFQTTTKYFAVFPVERQASTAHNPNPGGNPLNTFGLVYSLDPGGLGPDAADASPAIAKSVQVPKLASAPPNPSSAQENFSGLNQGFTTREGEFLFVDRLGSVGRLDMQSDFSGANVAAETELTTWVFEAASSELPEQLVPVVRQVTPKVGSVDLFSSLDSGFATDQSTIDGIDQYELAGPSGRIKGTVDKGHGAFRGTANAANVVFGSISQNDMISTTIFAETTRRQVAVVESPIPAGTVREGRMAFQVLRDGSLGDDRAWKRSATGFAAKLDPNRRGLAR